MFPNDLIRTAANSSSPIGFDTVLARRALVQKYRFNLRHEREDSNSFRGRNSISNMIFFFSGMPLEGSKVRMHVYQGQPVNSINIWRLASKMCVQH